MNYYHTTGRHSLFQLRLKLSPKPPFKVTGDAVHEALTIRSPPNRVFGDYDTNQHPEYYDEKFVFEPGRPYSFVVVFETGDAQFDFSLVPAIDICDGKDYFMACRIIPVGLEALHVSQAPYPDARTVK